jgi:Thiamine pyrophosphate enzyme, C-terminal TPP binding domain
MIIYLRGDR